jgi:hypothetical protein
MPIRFEPTVLLSPTPNSNRPRIRKKTYRISVHNTETRLRQLTLKAMTRNPATRLMGWLMKGYLKKTHKRMVNMNAFKSCGSRIEVVLKKPKKKAKK